MFLAQFSAKFVYRFQIAQNAPMDIIWVWIIFATQFVLKDLLGFLELIYASNAVMNVILVKNRINV